MTGFGVCNFFNGWDIAIYVDGVVLSALYHLHQNVHTSLRSKKIRDERTVASSIDGDDEEDEENANATSLVQPLPSTKYQSK
jgi:hypothetical protein